MKTVYLTLVFLTVSGLVILCCSRDKEPLVSYTHPSSWMNVKSDEFHGKKVVEISYSSCKSCHGTSLDGGKSGVSCFKCHQIYPHSSKWVELASAGFHGNYIRGENWSMQDCKPCHGNDYRGGQSQKSCYDCHTGSQGPETCNVCHGSQANAAPPEDLNNKTSTSEITIGAHQIMISNFVATNENLTIKNVCSVCHQLPGSISQAGHIDTTPHAEVLSSLGWDRNKRTCANSCHGEEEHVWNNFK